MSAMWNRIRSAWPAISNRLQGRRWCGKDLEGNEYFEYHNNANTSAAARTNLQGHQVSRQIKYIDEADISPDKIPVYAHQWLRFCIDKFPSHEEQLKFKEDARLFQIKVKEIEDNDKKLRQQEIAERRLKAAQSKNRANRGSGATWSQPRNRNQNLENIQDFQNKSTHT